MKGAMRLLSSRDTLAPATHATLTSLQALHPSAPLDRRAAPTTSSAPLHATPQAVLKAITSFPHGSAGGPDGLRPQHLKDLLDGVRGNVGSESVDGGTSGGGPRPIANPLLEAIADLVNLPAVGEVSQFARASLFSGSITALAKKGGGGQADQRSATPGVGWRGRWRVGLCLPALQPCWRRGSLALGSRVARKWLSMRVDSMSRTCCRVTCL